MERELIYIYDPLCGWCYGFSPVMQALQEKYKNTIQFTVKSGGMVTGDRVGPVSSIASYILSAYQRLEQMTGVKVGEPYLAMLREGKAIQNSEPGCIAMTIYKEKFPEQALHFAHALQKALFVEGKPSADSETFVQIAKTMGYDENDFRTKMNDEKYRKDTWFEIKEIQGWGIQGFPSLIYKKKDQYFLIARGYQSLDEIEETVSRIDHQEN